MTINGEKPVDGMNGNHVKPNNWKVPGSAAFNFKSDTTTTPTLSMLESITYTTLLDDVSQYDSTTNDLQSWIAELLGHPAGLLVTSGTMGNQLAARVHLASPPYTVVADATSHLFTYEAGGIASNCGALPIPIRPSNGRYMTLEDVQAASILHDDPHAAPTKLICIENTISGVITPLSECERICTWARSHGIKTHLDGARLWEVASANVSRDSSVDASNPQALHVALTHQLHAYGSLFDSATVCFSKGLGAPIGSMLVGSTPFIKQARHVRKSWGGGMRQTGIISAPARVAVEETFFGGLLVRSHEIAARIANMWTSKGGTLLMPIDTNMVWIDLAEPSRQRIWLAEAEREELLVYGGGRGRIVVHYQISDEAVDRLGRVFDRVFAGDEAGGVAKVQQGFAGYGGQAPQAITAGDGDEM